jgi:hypothetical protein
MTFIEDVRRGLEELRRLDAKLTLFGARRHRYALNPVLGETELASFEQRWGFRAPDDYRRFLLELGNGGAGPFYGVFPLGEMGDGADPQGWESWKLDPAKPFPHRERWNDRDIRFRSAPLQDDSVGDEAHAQAYQDWLDSDQAHADWLAYLSAAALEQGCIPLCHQGCGLRDWLVVTGPEAGHVWHDASADECGVSPIRTPQRPHTTFSEWYVEWLEISLRSL